MAWNGNNDNWKWQLRDRKGRWIEMGRGVKWYSPTLGREVSGTVVGQKGKDAVVSLTSEPNDPKTGKPQQVAVKGSDIEVIANKATLGKPAGETEAPKADAPEEEKGFLTPAAKVPSTAAPSRTADIEKDLGFLEQEAEDIAELDDEDERASAIEAAEYPFTNDAGEEVTMNLVDVDGEGVEIEVRDADGKELGRFGVPESLGERTDTAKAIRDTSNGVTPKPKADLEEEPAEEPVEAPEEPEAPETPEVAPEAPEEAPEAAEAPFSRDIQDVGARKALEAEVSTKGEDAGITMAGKKLTVTDPVKAIETARKVLAKADTDYANATGKVSRTGLFGSKRELGAVTRLLNEKYPAEARTARNGYAVAEADKKASTAPVASEAPKAPEPTAAPAPEESVAPKAPETSKTPAPQLSAEEALKAAGVTRTEPVALPGEKFAPTRQQQDIIDAVMAGKDTAVQALAGSGKTSTLEALAKRLQAQYPDKKIAYIAFNRSVKLEAEGRMPGNVESKTQHGLAYGWADKWMKDRTNDRTSLRRADDVAAFLGIKNTIRPQGEGVEPVSAKDQAMAAIRTVDTFANSAEDLPDASHMPEKIKAMGPEVEAAVIDAAQKIWADLNKPDGRMRYSLDHMRKQWALTKPDLSKAGSGLQRPADIIFMDEAQDTPKVMAKLMDQQTAQKVVVGDSNQNIYSSFTGSIDYMSQVKKDVELPLTKSWRFGPAVADIGNRFLELVGAPTRVEGGGDSKLVQGMEEPDAILVRSNAGMLGEILGEIEKGRTVGVPAGTKKDMQSLVDSAAFLKGQGEAPAKMHDDLAAYRSWDEVVAEADAGNATMTKIANMVNQHGIGGLRSILNQVVEKGGDGLSGMVLRNTTDNNVTYADGKTFGNDNGDYLKQAGFRFGEIPGAEPMKSGKNKGKPRKGWIYRGSQEEGRAAFDKARELSSGEAVDVTVSTAHKSKGLEWDKVKIGEDFRGPKVNEETGEVDMPSAEELRVAYVAVTRAKKELDAGSLGYVFEYTQENGGIPKPAETGEQDNAKEDEQPIPSAPDDPEAGSDAPEEDAPESRPEDDANREEVERANKENEEAPAPTPEEDAEPAPVAKETPVPEEDQAPEPEPEDLVDNPEEVPEPEPLPQKEAPTPEPAPEVAPEPEEEEEVAPAPEPTPEPEPAPEPTETPAPAPQTPVEEEAPAPAPEEAPKGGTAPPEPEAKPLHPVKVKAGNYPDGTVIRSARSGDSITKTGGTWHVSGKPNEAADPMDMDAPFVYDMPKQEANTFDPFTSIDDIGPGDIIITRKGTQAAVVGMRDGKIVVAAHNQTEEQRRLRPALVALDPTLVKGVNKFDAVAEAEATPKAPSSERKRTPFSGNRGNSNVTIKDVGGNELKIGDEVRTEQGTGVVVRVRPSDGPSGSAFVQFPDGTIKSFRSNKMRNTAFAEEVTGGDDPAKMEIGTMGEAGDGRAFMVGKGNKPIFKGDNVSLADGTTGKVSGFAKGVSSVNIRVEGRATDIRKKASVVDAVDYNAPATTTSESDSTPAPEAPATPEAESDLTPMETEPVVEAKPNETPEEREERISAATSNSKDPAFLSSWWDTVMKNDLTEEDIYKIAPDMKWKMEEMFKGELTRDGGGIMAAKGWGVAAWVASKDTNRSPEEQALMRDLQARITLFTQVQQEASENAAKELARQNKAPVRKPDASTPEENQSLKSDRALKPQPAFKDAELEAYAGIETGAWGDDLFGDNSKLNVFSTAGKDLGNTHTVTNSRGNVFRQGAKVYSARVGRYIGVVAGIRMSSDGKTGVSVRKGEADALKYASGGDMQTYDIEQLISQDAPPVWKKQEDLKFDSADNAFDISNTMSRAYPGVDFKFRENIPLDRAKEYAETVSKMLNKYPQLSATLVSVESSPIDPNLQAFAYAATTDRTGLRDTKVVFNAGVGTKIRRAMRGGANDKYFNNIPEGREMEYVMTHEFGHALDYLTGNISDEETYELMKELLPPEVLADKRKLGRYLFSNGMVSEYSTQGNQLYTVELVAESFADVEINGASAKPISKLIHAELMKRLDEITGGTGVIPAGPAV